MKKITFAVIVIFLIANFFQYLKPEGVPVNTRVNLECGEYSPQAIDRHYKEGWNLNRQLVAAKFGIYAAASFDVYLNREISERKKSIKFKVADNKLPQDTTKNYGKTNWEFIKRKEKFGGLAYDIYEASDENTNAIIVVYRGTESWFGSDGIANFSWITQWINPWDQFRQARSDFVDIYHNHLIENANESVEFILTGHSLGGGIAQHVAGIFPCTTAITFNSSFVTQNLLYGEHRPKLIKIYEKGDIFEKLRSKIVNSKAEAVYRLNLTPKDEDKKIISKIEHNMERLAAGMARMATNCKKDNGELCEVTDVDQELMHTIYCKRYLSLRKAPISDDKTCGNLNIPPSINKTPREVNPSS